VLLLAALAFFGGLGRGAIADSDEAFYAEAAREMIASGDWLTPHFNYDPRFQKPPLYYWLTAVTYLVLGPTEFAARLWSAIAGVGLAIVTMKCGRRWFDDTTGLLAGAITATSFGYFAIARMALPDLPLAFFITVTIWTAFVATLERERNPRRWLVLAAASAALGFLMKGPLAVVIPALVVVPTLLLERRTFNLREADFAIASVWFVAIAAPWYVAMWMTHGPEYLQGFFVGDNYERFTTTRFNDPRPWSFYLPVMAGGLLPWTPLTIAWLSPMMQFLTRRRDVRALDVRLILWIVLPLAFFTVSVGKQPRYILPILPPLAILLASSIVERTSEWRALDGTRVRPRQNRTIVFGCVLSGMVLVAIGALLYRARVLFINISDTLVISVAVVIALAGAMVVGVSWAQSWRAGPGVLACAAAVAFAVLPYGTLPAAQDSTVAQMARLVRTHHVEGEAIGTFKVFVRNLVFYTQLKHTDLIHDEHIADWLTKNPRALIVLPPPEADRLERERGVALQRLAELPYFDDGAIRIGTLLWPEPASDVTKVALIRIGR
jgi:4-amino-4-deoxy-L-arabinose transferase-like glycosyltransferase